MKITQELLDRLRKQAENKIAVHTTPMEISPKILIAMIDKLLEYMYGEDD